MSINVWCGIIDERLIGAFMIQERRRIDHYLHFLEDDLPTLLDDVPLKDDECGYNTMAHLHALVDKIFYIEIIRTARLKEVQVFFG